MAAPEWKLSRRRLRPPSFIQRQLRLSRHACLAILVLATLQQCWQQLLLLTTASSPAAAAAKPGVRVVEEEERLLQDMLLQRLGQGGLPLLLDHDSLRLQWQHE